MKNYIIYTSLKIGTRPQQFLPERDYFLQHNSFGLPIRFANLEGKGIAKLPATVLSFYAVFDTSGLFKVVFQIPG